MPGRTIHTSMNIEGAIRLSDRELRGWVRDDAGRVLSPSKAREALRAELAKGREVLPFGEPCEGFDYVKGCPGHPYDGDAPDEDVK